MKNIRKFGLYNIKDIYFLKFKSKYFTDNKKENRPFYCSFIDYNNTIWLIPLSTQTQNYKKKIKKDEEKYGKCIFYHVGDIAGKERVFLIGNMFPVTQKYIKKEFEINRKHYIVSQNKLKRPLQRKASTYIKLVRQGRLKPNVNILEIEKQLLSEKKLF